MTRAEPLAARWRRLALPIVRLPVFAAPGTGRATKLGFTPMNVAVVRGGSSLQLALLCLAWLAVFRAPLAGLYVSTPIEALRINACLGLGLLVLVALRARPATPTLTPRPGPLLVVALALAAHIGVASTLDIDHLSGVAMVVGAWGLAGLTMPADRWRQTIPLAIAGICVLPLGAALDLVLGFPLRVATASMIHGLIAPLGLGDVTAETIVVIEGAGVQVDLPCSGVRSLWSGAVFWTAATWIERRRVGALWCLAGAAFVVLLVGFNGARVLSLVLLHGLHADALTRALHVPLGLSAFATAAALGWGMLRRLPAVQVCKRAGSQPAARPGVLWVLVAVLVVVAALPSRSHRPPPAPAAIELDDPSLHRVALDPQELAMLAARRADAAGKWSFALGEGRGQLIIVSGRSWRAQHRPDICHVAHGRHLQDEVPVLLAPQLPVRWLRLHDATTESTGVYWFQSATHTTNEHGARIWSALVGDAEPWVMVSVIVDQPLSLSDQDLRARLLDIHARANALLNDPESTP